MINDIVERTFEFAATIIRMANVLPRSEVGEVIARQVIRSGTSVGANVEEAQGSSTKKDFVNKMSIALREARETNYWLRLSARARLISGAVYGSALKESEEIRAILISIVKNAKKN